MLPRKLPAREPAITNGQRDIGRILQNKFRLHELPLHAGVTGKITIDADRNANKPAVVLEIKDGKFIYRETILPE